MTTYPLTFPTTVSPNAIRITPSNAIGQSESPFNYSEKVYDWGGERWLIDASLPPMRRAVAEEYIAFFTALKGRYGTFLMRIPAHRAAQGAVSGTPLVAGESQTGATLDIDGLALSTTAIVKAGDFFNLGTGSSTRLHKSLTTVNSDGSGAATLSIWPALRESPTDNSAVTFADCVGHFTLTGDVSYDVDVNKFYNISFSAVEVV